MERVHLEDVVVVSDLPGCCEEKAGDPSGLCAPLVMAPLVTSGMDLLFPMLPASSLQPPDLDLALLVFL